MYLQVVYESDSAAGDRENTLHGPVFSSVLQMRSDEFDMEFEEKFELEKKGYSKQATLKHYFIRLKYQKNTEIFPDLFGGKIVIPKKTQWIMR